MDRVFVHLRQVRCPTCSRVFCCSRHRIEHERRVHVDAFAAVLPPPVPVIKRRFRSAAAADHPKPKPFAAVNCRKRLHADHQRPEQPYPWSRQCLDPRGQPDAAAKAAAAERVILKAASRSSLSLSVMRPVAESSPAVPPPPPSSTATPGHAAAAAAELSFPVGPPSGAGTPVGSDAGTPVGSEAGSPASFYQTPMLTTPPSTCAAAANEETVVADAAMYTTARTLADSAVRFSMNATSIVDITPIRDPRTVADPNSISLGRNSSQKGFFWSNMARRFRLALRPAKPKECSTPEGTPLRPVVDIAKLYGGIRPRRPINNETMQTPVHPRLALEVIRQAHEEATSKSSSE